MYDARSKHARLNRMERDLGSLVEGATDGVKDVGGQLADGAGGITSQVAGKPQAPPSSVKPQSPTTSSSSTGRDITSAPLASSAIPRPARSGIASQPPIRTSPIPTPAGRSKPLGGLLGNAPVIGKVVGDATNLVEGGANAIKDPAVEVLSPSRTSPSTPSGTPSRSPIGGNLLGNVPIVGDIVPIATAAVGGIGSAAVGAVGGVTSVVGEAVHGATSVVGNVASAATVLAGEVVGDVSSVGDEVVGVAASLGGEVVHVVTSVAGDAAGAVQTLIHDGVKAVKTLPQDPIGAVTNLVEDVPKAVVPLVEDLISAPVSLVHDVVSAGASVVGHVVSDATALAGHVVGNATSIVFGDVVPLATSIVGDTVPIVTSLVGEVGGVVTSAAGALVSVIADGGSGAIPTVIVDISSQASQISSALSSVKQGIGVLPSSTPPPSTTIVTDVVAPSASSPTAGGSIAPPVTPTSLPETAVVPPTVSPLDLTTSAPFVISSTIPTIINEASSPVFSRVVSASLTSTSGGSLQTSSLDPALVVIKNAGGVHAANVDDNGISGLSTTENGFHSRSGSADLPSPTNPTATPTSHLPVVLGGVIVPCLFVFFVIISYFLYRVRRKHGIRLSNRSSGSSWQPLVGPKDSASPTPQQLEAGDASDQARHSWRSSSSSTSMASVNRDYQTMSSASEHPLTLHNPFWDPSDTTSLQAVSVSRTPSLTHSISSDATSSRNSDDGKSSTRIPSFISEESATTTASSIAIAGPGSNRKESVGYGPRIAALFGIFGASGHYAPKQRDSMASEVSRISQTSAVETIPPPEKRQSSSARSDTRSTTNALLNASWKSPLLVSLLGRSSSSRNRTQ